MEHADRGTPLTCPQWQPAAVAAVSYSSWRRHQTYGSPCGVPAGESSHASWRPNGVMSRNDQTLPSFSVPPAVDHVRPVDVVAVAQEDVERERAVVAEVVEE